MNPQLQEALAGLALHAHACMLYQDRHEQVEAAAAFLRLGLERGEQCVYVADGDSGQAVLAALTAQGVEAPPGALIVATRGEVFPLAGRTDPGTLIASLEQAIQDALAAGFSGLRTAGLFATPGDDAWLLEHESRLSSFLAAHPCLCLCQYERAGFAPEILHELTRVHPVRIYGQERRTAEPAEGELKRLLDHASDIIFITDLEGNLTWLNQAAERITGYTVADGLTHSALGIVAPEHQELAREMLRAKLDGQECTTYELEIVSRDGQRVPLELSTRLLLEGGRPTGVLGIARDVTERRQAERALRESEQSYRTLFEAMTEGVVCEDGEGRIVSANPAALEITGLTLEQMQAGTPADPPCRTVRPDGSPLPLEALPARVALRNGLPVRGVVLGVFNSRRAEYRWVCTDAIPQFKPGQRQPSLVYTLFRDVTEQKRAQDSLRRQKELLQTAFDHIPVMVMVLDPDGKFLLVNREAERVLGWSLEDTRAVDVLDQCYPDPDYRQQVWDFIASATSQWRDFRTRARSGRLLDTSWANVRLSDGSIIGIGQDVTDRKQNERLLRASEQRFRSLLEHGSELIALLDADWTIRYASPSHQAVFGYPPQELIGRQVADFLDPEDLAKLQQAFTDTLPEPAASIRLEARVRHRDGDWRIHDSVATSLLHVPEVAGVVINSRDVTERVRAQQRLAFLARLLEEVSDAVISLDPDCRITSWNRAAEEVYGWKAEEAVGRQLQELVPVKECEDVCRRVQKEGTWKGEIPLRRRDGREIVTDWSLSAIRDAAGAFQGMVSVSRDVTARRQADAALRALAASLLTAQEDERRRLSRELHDDLNQKLAMLAVDVEALQQRDPLSPAQTRQALHSLKSRLAALSDDVHRLAYQLHPTILEHLGLAVALQACCQEFSGRENIQARFLHRSVPEAIPPQLALCLYRVAQEALRNVARHSGSPRVTLVLSGTRRDLRLSVTDFGAGFDPQAVESRGGLGLVSMEERVRLAGGRFTVRSRPGEGARIEVRVPLPARTA